MTFSVAGSITSVYAPDFGSTNLPLMNSLVRPLLTADVILLSAAADAALTGAAAMLELDAAEATAGAGVAEAAGAAADIDLTQKGARQLVLSGLQHTAADDALKQARELSASERAFTRKLQPAPSRIATNQKLQELERA
jgi:hypothetical protein